MGWGWAGVGGWGLGVSVGLVSVSIITGKEWTDFHEMFRMGSGVTLHTPEPTCTQLSIAQHTTGH